MDKHTCIHSRARVCGDKCAMGIKYSSVTIRPDEPGAALREACRMPEGWSSPRMRELAKAEERGTCEHFRLPTNEELKEHEKEMSLLFTRLILASNLVAEKKAEIGKGKSWAGVMTCPNCGKGMSVSIAPNGHAMVKCETSGCVNYIE